MKHPNGDNEDELDGWSHQSSQRQFEDEERQDERPYHTPRRAGRQPLDGGPLGGENSQPGGGDGNGGLPGGGGNRGVKFYPGYPFITPGAPYSNMVLTTELKFKIESLPSWDGDHRLLLGGR
ncbi:hypothetical protein C8R45DRAFT_948392 [Mycena sanguinolenta]|nr:hypothetical protein C8R45DRAFT_948392 [Mycena sanguinolenta]